MKKEEEEAPTEETFSDVPLSAVGIPLEIEHGIIQDTTTSREQLQWNQQVVVHRLKQLKRMQNWVVVLVVLLFVLVITFFTYNITRNTDPQQQAAEPTTVSEDPTSRYPHHNPPDAPELEPFMQASEQCNVPAYSRNPSPFMCEEIVPGHPNSYWYNELFLCRLNNRPCDNGIDYVHNPGEIDTMDLGADIGNGNTVVRNPVNAVSKPHDYGAGEVWMFATDRNGEPIVQVPEECYRFYSEGYWRFVEETLGEDYNDYLFDSLQCCDDDEPENVRIFVLIDGVLVDSCPKRFSHNCRHC